MIDPTLPIPKPSLPTLPFAYCAPDTLAFDLLLKHNTFIPITSEHWYLPSVFSSQIPPPKRSLLLLRWPN